MFRNPVAEFSLSSRRSFRPVCEQLEERLVLDGNHTTTSTMPTMADPAAFAQVVGLTDVVVGLEAQVAAKVQAASSGVDLKAAKRVNRLVANIGRLIQAIQQVESQVVASQASVNDPNFHFADILFRSAVADYQSIQNVADGLEADIINNIAGAARAAASTHRQVTNAINTGNELKTEAQNFLKGLGIGP